MQLYFEKQKQLRTFKCLFSFFHVFIVMIIFYFGQVAHPPSYKNSCVLVRTRCQTVQLWHIVILINLNFHAILIYVRQVFNNACKISLTFYMCEVLKWSKIGCFEEDSPWIKSSFGWSTPVASEYSNVTFANNTICSRLLLIACDGIEQYDWPEVLQGHSLASSLKLWCVAWLVLTMQELWEYALSAWMDLSHWLWSTKFTRCHNLKHVSEMHIFHNGTQC